VYLNPLTGYGSSKRVFSMQLVSNHTLTNDDFADWQSEMSRGGKTVLSKVGLIRVLFCVVYMLQLVL
jgi:hypothetical protein